MDPGQCSLRKSKSTNISHEMLDFYIWLLISKRSSMLTAGILIMCELYTKYR